MKKNLWLLLSLCFLIMPVMAEDWLLIPNTNVSYDKDSIEYGDFGVVRVITKNPVDNIYELNDLIILKQNYMISIKENMYTENSLIQIGKIFHKIQT